MRLSSDHTTLWLVSEPESELRVDLGTIVSGGVAERGHDVPYLVNEHPDLVSCHAGGSMDALQDLLGAPTLALNLSHPPRDDGWVDATVERRPVFGQALVTAADGLPGAALVAALICVSIEVPASSVAQRATAASGSWSAVSGGEAHACAVKNDATLWCWGDNGGGQLGIGSTEDQHSPSQVGSDPWLSVAAGGAETCGVRTDHTMWCWGTGPLGRGERYDTSTIPVRIGVGAAWKTVSVGDRYACATRVDDTLWCWGNDYDGQLGLGKGVHAWNPRQVGPDADWAQVRASIFSTTCGIKTNGSDWCWGVYFSKRENYREQYTPRQLNDAVWTSISVFSGVQADGSLWRWLRGYVVKRYTDDTWTSVLERDGTICGIQTDDTLRCRGDGAHGNLGHGTHDQRHFIQITQATNWSRVDGGHQFGVGLRSDGTLWARGLNNHGQVGDGTTTDRHHPVQITA